MPRVVRGREGEALHVGTAEEQKPEPGDGLAEEKNRG
jgi:hypothetical protein